MEEKFFSSILFHNFAQNWDMNDRKKGFKHGERIDQTPRKAATKSEKSATFLQNSLENFRL